MNNIKYKVGDRVKIKSVGWYNENKDEFGEVKCGNQIFSYPMTKLCGKTVTITCVNAKDCYYVISGDNGYNSWTDEMIECKVEEEDLDLKFNKVTLKWTNIIENWLSISKEHNDEIKQAQDDFMNAFVERHQGCNEFDLVTIAQVFTMAYCLGKNSK